MDALNFFFINIFHHRLNETQSKNLEEAMNDKNALVESYAMVTELENLLSEEKEKLNKIDAKLERER